MLHGQKGTCSPAEPSKLGKCWTRTQEFMKTGLEPPLSNSSTENLLPPPRPRIERRTSEARNPEPDSAGRAHHNISALASAVAGTSCECARRSTGYTIAWQEPRFAIWAFTQSCLLTTTVWSNMLAQTSAFIFSRTPTGILTVSAQNSVTSRAKHCCMKAPGQNASLYSFTPGSQRPSISEKAASTVSRPVMGTVLPGVAYSSSKARRSA
mmetsp:Transcript_48826/g.129421  ORF Transcript_48826/g.129421 Transcript_48826/m.129421 type:complete len:210 (+) Transcript_48826:270-899(+)